MSDSPAANYIGRSMLVLTVLLAVVSWMPFPQLELDLNRVGWDSASAAMILDSP